MKKSRAFLNKLTKNGFYIILFICITAIGVSGYVMFMGNNSLNANTVSDEWDSGLEFPVPSENSKYNFESTLGQKPLTLPDKPAVSKQTDSTTKTTAPAKSVKTKTAAPKQSKPKTDAELASKEITIPDEPIKIVSALNGRIDVPFSGDELVKSKTLGDWRTHSGVDIIAQSGTKVSAVADGTVKDAYQDEMMGYTVVIEHKNGMVSIYANLMKGIVVKKGQNVKAGEVIGGVGSSSLAECMDEPHLHLEIKQNGVPIDPMSVINSKT